MTFLFIIQGEGRGHMTQAVALARALKDDGHQVETVLMGKSPQRKVPGFIADSFQNKLYFFHSPNFIRSRNKKGIQIFGSILFNSLLLPLFLFEIIRMAVFIRRTGADRVVNFYEAIGGIAYWLSFSRKPFFTISHQYFLSHPVYKRPESGRFQWTLLRLYSYFCALGAKKKLALSFDECPDIPSEKLYVVPPLLREEIYRMKPVDGDYIMVYLLNPGLISEIKIWCREHPAICVRLFTDAVIDPRHLSDNFILNPLSGDHFLNSLRDCHMLVCTAGFETVAEAAFLGKKIVVIPSVNHFEQECNAADAVRAGVANHSKFFDPGISEGDLLKDDRISKLQQWFRKNPSMVVEHLLKDAKASD